jgi:hypothetical protein
MELLNQAELQKKIDEHYLKYTYYINGLNIASIGFIVSINLEAHKNLSLLLLGASTACFLFSGSFGLRLLNKKHIISYVELSLILKSKEGESLSDITQKYLDDTKALVDFYFKQINYFYGGIVFFIIWKVITLFF